MSAPIVDCPICLTAIEGVSNVVVTECGHSFHCSCLMHNVFVNGFDCPYCRTKMVRRTVATPVTDPVITPVTDPFPVTVPLAPEVSDGFRQVSTYDFVRTLFLNRVEIGGQVVLWSSNEGNFFNPYTLEEIGHWEPSTAELSAFVEGSDDMVVIWTPDSGLPFPVTASVTV